MFIKNDFAISQYNMALIDHYWLSDISQEDEQIISTIVSITLRKILCTY